jgi:phosphohistidine phosphatase
MKKLTLFRHAKSGWDDPVTRDFDRPLNARGRRAAVRMGQYIRDHRLHFDRITGSPAVRVVETLEYAANGLGEMVAPAWDRRVYLASAVSLLEVIHDTPEPAESLLLVGHNPGLEDLALMLTPDRAGDENRDQVEEKFPTAAIAEIEFDVDRWEDVKVGGGAITRFVRPRDLDPELGPDKD